MTEPEFGQIINAFIASRDPQLKCVSALQYESQLRDLNKSFATERDPRDFESTELESYVLSVQSPWTRRRAVSVLVAFYAWLDRAERAEGLRDLGCCRPAYVEERDLARSLLRDGWTKRQLRALRWSDVRDDLIPARKPVDQRFRGRVRTTMRKLLCRRYPRTDRLLSDGPREDAVFRSDELASLKR